MAAGGPRPVPLRLGTAAGDGVPSGWAGRRQGHIPPGSRISAWPRGRPPAGDPPPVPRAATYLRTALVHHAEATQDRRTRLILTARCRISGARLVASAVPGIRRLQARRPGGGSFSASWYGLSPAAVSPSSSTRKARWPPSTPDCRSGDAHRRLCPTGRLRQALKQRSGGRLHLDRSPPGRRARRARHASGAGEGVNTSRTLPARMPAPKLVPGRPRRA